MNKFNDKPNFYNCYDGPNCEYLGTWYWCDAYIVDKSLLIRWGNKDHEYNSSPNIGWNPYNPTSRVGGLGNNRTRCEIDIEGIEGYNNDQGRAKISALSFLGRRYLDEQ